MLNQGLYRLNVVTSVSRSCCKIESAQ